MQEFTRVLQSFKDSKIAIYGLGVETEKILGILDKNIQIVGLLDGYLQEGELYHLPIISLERAVKEEVKLIIVAARPGSCKVIAKRIGAVCEKNQIVLLDSRGNNLLNVESVHYDFKEVNGISKKQFEKMIEKSEIVTVDLFDTILMRQTLFSTDVFDLMEVRLRERQVLINNFSEKRVRIEKEFAKYGQVNLESIYSRMLEQESEINTSAKDLAELEWKIDKTLLTPRRILCEILQQEAVKGKRIYIVSDTYYTSKQLNQLLKEKGITFYAGIFTSCEYGTAKTQNLFNEIKGELQRDEWLHVGDDWDADIQSAQRNGLRVCRLYSGLDLLEKVGYFKLWNQMESLSDRLKVGMLVAKLFNSPFQFEKEEAKITVTELKEIGYLFFAPMITDFMIWFHGQIENEHIDNIWLGARDGYLIQKLYSLLDFQKQTIYFLTSRTAAIRAGVQEENDIYYVAKMKYSGSVEAQLKQRFGITIGVKEDKEPSSNTILDFAQVILEKAKEKKKNYRKYISSLKMKVGEIAFFDFVAKGTTQLFLEKIADQHLKGFYFLRLERKEMEKDGIDLDITPFYSDDEKETSAIFENYYILETILTAPDASVKEFDELGMPIYSEETRKSEDIECFMQVQQGIVEYFKTYIQICPMEERKINKKIDETFLRLISKINIDNREFLSLKVEDPFFNRTTDINNIL